MAKRFKLTAPIAPEDELHHSVFMALRVLLPSGAVINTWELRNAKNAVEGARRKRLGARAGWPDMGIYWNKRHIMLELKRARRGTLSQAQKSVHADLWAQGFTVRVCRSVEDALKACTEVGIPVRGRPTA